MAARYRPLSGVKPTLAPSRPVPPAAPSRIARFQIAAMDCPTEEALIRKRLADLDGVISLDFDLMQRRLAVHHNLPSTDPIVAAIAELGMSAEPVRHPGRSVIRVMQMDCPVEERLIHDQLSRLDGVGAVEFNLISRTLTVEHGAAALEPILAAIRELGFSPELLDEQRGNTSELPADPPKPWWPLALAGVAALGSEIAHWAGLAEPWLPSLLALAAVLGSGLTTYKKGWISLKHRNLNINALMTIAVTGAFLIGQWPEAAMVMVLFALAERIEAASLDRARNAIRSLMALAPEQALVRQADGAWKLVDAKEVAIGARVRLKPGERVALDGRVVRGNSSVNQAPVTGESVPVDKAVGDSLFAGTINQDGELDYEVMARADDSTLSRIIHAVEAAQGSRAPTQRFVDRFAEIYTPTVFVLALLVALIPPLWLGGGWLDWIYKALVLLVIACPCALVISTPVTLVSGLANAARQGLLVKGGVYLEQGKRLRWLALDKTGTLTHGKPVLTETVALAGLDQEAVLKLAVALAARSDHPISKAIAANVQEAQAVEAFTALPGRGVSGRVEGKRHHLGNVRLMRELGHDVETIASRLETLERQGKTVVLLADESRILAMFGVADTIKDNSRQAIAELHRLGVKTLMLSGDNRHTAAAIADQLGIDEVRAELLPEDKDKAIAELVGQGGSVGMVGDGINDAPALARADIGFAMGAAGTDTAIEAADVALMDDDLRKIPAFIRLSRKTSAVLMQNIALALGIKLVFLALTVAGMGTMWMAVFADVGASLLVVGNGLKLLSHKNGY
ncbi:heavy metal translocating P-type ATPase [Chitinimonas lacunae]|uniref:P-type Zn(2+) transporter n=1 Tax=Chitinimonas lacunae TaxID=1963018 RepID=A0ABV8MUB8_9NEIS